MAASGCSILRPLAHSHGHRSGKTTQRLAARKQANLIRTINPEFKDLARWKMITVHEKMYP